jgi:hypothetical protein
MFNPFDSPMGDSLVRMMAETKTGNIVFNQQGGQANNNSNGGKNGASCFGIASNTMSSSLSQKYHDSNNNYRIYSVNVYGVSSGQSNYGMDSYYWLSWDSATAPTSLQKSNYIKYFRQKNHTIPSSNCDTFTNAGFVELGSSMDWKGWETYRDIHESANAGCTDNNSPNYDSTALTLDNSCQFYEDNWSSGFSKNSSTASDGVRFEGRTVFMRRPIIGDKSEGYFVATIDKVCTSSSCSVKGVRPKTVAWTYTTPTFEWTSSSTPYVSAKATSKTALETNLATLEAGYVPNCTLTAQPSNQWKKVTACDKTSFSINKTLFTSNCNGSVEKIIYTFSNNEVYTWEKSSGMSSSKFETDTPADTRAGYGGLVDRLNTLKEIQDQTLGSTTETKYVKSGEHTQGAVGSDLGQQLFITVRSIDVITDGCGKKTQGAYQYMGYLYDYNYQPSVSLLKPEYDKLDGGFPVVLLGGLVITPTTTFGPYDKMPTYAELLGTVVRGCMDSTAENYDATANTPAETSVSKKCRYAEVPTGDGDGNGGGTAISGCTSSLAANYNSNATVDDGSCTPKDNTKLEGGISPIILVGGAIALISLIVIKR